MEFNTMMCPNCVLISNLEGVTSVCILNCPTPKTKNYAIDLSEGERLNAFVNE